MKTGGDPGRIAGLWYLCLVVLGPLRLIVIPNKLFVTGDAAATASNIAAHLWLFRAGVAADLVGAVVLVLLALALFRLFRGVDTGLATQVVIFGGVMPALLYFVNVTSDLGVLMVMRGPEFLNVFDKPQRDAIVLLLLRMHDLQNTAAEMLWGVWLIPLAILTWRSRFLPRFLGVWLVLNGIAYVVLSLTGVISPGHQGDVFTWSQPAMMGELAFMLWLVVRGARPPAQTA